MGPADSEQQADEASPSLTLLLAPTMNATSNTGNSSGIEEGSSQRVRINTPPRSSRTCCTPYCPHLRHNISFASTSFLNASSSCTHTHTQIQNTLTPTPTTKYFWIDGRSPELQTLQPLSNMQGLIEHRDPPFHARTCVYRTRGAKPSIPLIPYLRCLMTLLSTIWWLYSSHSHRCVS